MPLNIKLNLDNSYKLKSEPTLDYFVFTAVLKGGSKIPIVVIIHPPVNELMPDVYDLSYGPVDENQMIDENVILSFNNPSKVFSTLAFAALFFLNENPGAFLGISAVDTRQALLYRRLIKDNFDYIAHYYQISGVEFYAKQDIANNKDGNKGLKPGQTLQVSNEIKDVDVDLRNLFSYYLLKLKRL